MRLWDNPEERAQYSALHLVPDYPQKKEAISKKQRKAKITAIWDFLIPDYRNRGKPKLNTVIWEALYLMLNA